MADFCLGPHDIIGIARQVQLMPNVREGRHSSPDSSEGRSGTLVRSAAAMHRLRHEPRMCAIPRIGSSHRKM
jgi:hypothetical protein